MEDVMQKLFGVIGLALGGFIGFLNRPAAILIGQLPFDKIMLAGTNLRGIDKLFVPVARTSFYYTLIGAIIGLVLGLILGVLFLRSPKS
jgi:hypothetical protein